MSLSFNALMTGFVFGIFGMFLIRQARARANPSFGVIGLAMILFPYLVENAWIRWGIGAALLGAAYRMRNE